MVIIYTSSRRAVLRRFAALLIAPQRFVCYYASCRTTPQRFLSRCPASQLNDLFVTPLHFASLCSSALRLAPLLCTPQLNNLFVTTHRAALLLDASPRTNVHRISAQRDDLFVTSPRSALLLRSTYRNATRLNDLFVTSLHYTPLRFAALFSDTHRSSSLLNDLFVTPLRRSTLLASPRRHAPLRSAAQRFVCHNATIRPAMQLVWPRRAAAHCISPQLNDLFVTSLLGASLRASSLCCTASRITPRRNSSQRTETLTRKTNVQTFETNFGNV